MIPMSNPITALVQSIRSGGNPQTLLAQMARQDPQVAQAMGMLQGKNSQQLRAMAENMARERGVSVDDVARQLGLAIPSER